MLPFWAGHEYPLSAVGGEYTHAAIYFAQTVVRSMRVARNHQRRKPRLGGRWLTYSAKVPEGFTSHRATRRVSQRRSRWAVDYETMGPLRVVKL